MEDIFGILTFILFLALGLWQTVAGKSKKQTEAKKRSVQPPLEPVSEAVPPIVKPIKVRQVVSNNKPVHSKSASSQTKSKKAIHKYSFMPEEEGKRSTVDSLKKGNAESMDVSLSETTIRMHSPEDARRAFIYSEIFKRKY